MHCAWTGASFICFVKGYFVEDVYVERICYFLSNLESINLKKMDDKKGNVCKRVGRFVYSKK